MEDKQKLRLDIIKSAEQIGISKTAELFNINRKTVSKWLQRFKDGGEDSLTNKSKKHQNQPEKMPFDIENQLLEFKKNNPKLSANKIKELLNLDYSITAINKKIREAGLNRKVVNESVFFDGTPFSEFYVYVKKIPMEELNENLPNYQIIVEGLSTGMEFIGYSFERSSVSVAIFLDYLISRLLDCGLGNTNFKFFYNESSFYSKKKSPVESIVVDKYGFVLDNSPEDSIRARAFFFNYITESKFTGDKLNNENDLLIKSYAFLLYFNYHRIYELNSVKSISLNLGLMRSIAVKIPPIIVDNYMVKLKEISKDKSFWQQYESSLLDISRNSFYYFIKISEFTFRNMKNDKALEFLRQMLIILKLVRNYEIASYLYFNIGRICQRIGRSEKAVRSFKISLKLAEKYNNNKLMLSSIGLLAVQYHILGDVKLAMEYAKKQQKIAEKLADKLSLLDSFLIQGVIHETIGDYNNSLKYYKKVIDNASTNDSTLKKIKALGNVGVVYYNKGNLKKALQYNKEAYDLCVSSNNNLQMARLLNNMGVIYDETGEFDNAMFNYKQLLSISKKINSRSWINTATNNIGNIYLNKGEFSEALIQFNSILEDSQSIGDLKLASVAFGNIADIYKNIKKYKNAIEYYNNAIELAKKVNAKYYLCSYLCELGVVYYLQKSYDKAWECAEIAYNTALDVERKDMIFEAKILKQKIKFFEFSKSSDCQSKQDSIIKEIIAEMFKDTNKENLAFLNYTVYELLNSDSCCELKMIYDIDTFKRNAIKQFKKLYENIPKYLYKMIIEQLEENG
ncbi:MAG: tetratricopeptide repeat protein [Candidatus Delongbacteria bacterium]|nr:tetratricopeptide repeat protein [Candidatus Delongbacteria bacterium]MBN2834213.1 tetratricopeptide repeat protein [Candidatus Delongbacteria bacterium]